MKYIFILSPSYSGSTILYKLINTSPNISTLISNANPSHVGEGCALFHMTNKYKIKNYLKIRTNPNVRLPMDLVKEAYESIWDTNKPILCDKSIPTLYRAKHYDDYFKQFGEVYFISLIRNPYFTRHNMKEWYNDACYVKHNIESFKNLIHITYEDLTNNIENVIDKILNFVPELETLNKNVTYVNGIRDYNRNCKIINYNVNPINKEEKNATINHNKEILEIMNYFNYEYIK